jgi:hypothetical protein
MELKAFFEKTEAVKDQYPYDTIRPLLKWVVLDTRHLQKWMEVLQNEIDLLTRATNQSESLLDKWGLPWATWYCPSYWNHTREIRGHKVMLLESFAFDSTQPVRWEGEKMLVSKDHHLRERLKEYAISQGAECEYRTINPAFAQMVRIHLRENESACREFGELVYKAVRLQQTHARKFAPGRTPHPDQQNIETMPF